MIADYGFLSDCETCALVAPSGSVEWMCLPRMDSPSVFGAMLDRGAGSFRLGPADALVPAGRRYLPGTMVLETTWDTPTGWAVMRDVLAIGPWRRGASRSNTHKRVPSDHDGEKVLIRTVRCLSGSMDFVLECEPAFDYGRQRAVWHHVGDTYGEAAAGPEDDAREIRLTTDLNLGFEGPRAMARRRLRAGDQVFAPCPGATRRRPKRSRTPTPDWRTRGTSGTSGSVAADSRTIRGAPTSSGRR